MNGEDVRFVDGYLAALLAQASQLISSEFHEVVRRHGLSVSEWRVLASLEGSDGRAMDASKAKIEGVVIQSSHDWR